MSEQTNDRVFLVTVTVLKKYENAVRARESLRTAKLRAGDALDAAKLAFERACAAENDAIDAELAAAAELCSREAK